MNETVLALFDLDHTLLTLDSDEAWVEFLMEEGTLDRRNSRAPTTPTCERKVTRFEAWLAERGRALEDFGQSWFYSDSVNDLPLLMRVTHPVAVNADPPLAALARMKRWPQIQLSKLSR